MSRYVSGGMLVVLVSLVFAVPMLALAQESIGFPYFGTNPPLLPCTGDGVGDSVPCTNACQLLQLAQRVLYAMLSIAVVLIAPIAIAIGGIVILTSAGSSSGMSKGREMITGTIYGVLMALGAFVILNIFFTLMGITLGANGFGWSNIQCNVSDYQAPPPPVTTVTTSTQQTGTSTSMYGWAGATVPSGTFEDEPARAVLAGRSIPVNKPNCTFAGATDCTSLDGIPNVALDGIVNLKIACNNCFVRVTGGTEAGHQTHRMGWPNIDLGFDPALDAHIESVIRQGDPNIQTIGTYTYYCGSDHNRYYKENNHWHVEFGRC